MGRIDRDVYRPDPARADVYDELYAEYVQLHDYFGRGANQVMHRLRAIRDRVRKAARPPAPSPSAPPGVEPEARQGALSSEAPAREAGNEHGGER